MQYAELVLSLGTGNLLFSPPSSSQADQNRLGGPEKSLSERSLRVGREEQPPIAVVVHSLTGSAIYFLMLLNMNGCMYVY